MQTHMINGDTAHVYFDNDRAFWGCPPWVATWDGYDGSPIDYDTPSRDPIGEGSSAQEALEDLMEKSDVGRVNEEGRDFKNIRHGLQPCRSQAK